MSKAAIIGGGAAGMMAAVLLARRGCEVHLFEKNEKVGKKLYITGKGRCNLTNNCEQSDLLNHVISNPRFMYSAFSAFDAQDVMAFFANEGLDLKTERGNRVFPVSDKSSDVIRTLEKAMKKENVNVHLRTTVKKVVAEDYAPSEEAPEQESRKGGKKAAVGCACGVITEPGGFFPADAVLVASGGLSYPTTGSTGDGYRFAQETGHKVTECEPSLVPLLTAEDYIPEMQGLSLKNTGLTIKSGKKTVYSDFGEMMFTHNGVTGPMILSASAVISKQLKKGPLNAFLDLKPALTPEKLAAYGRAGVNRLSLGAQSFDDGLLKSLGRIHTAAQIGEAVAMARAAGFGNINLDLMYALPGQTEGQWRDTLERAAALGVEHVSAYSLIVEEGTPMAARVASGRAALPEDDAVNAMQRRAIDILAEAGYGRYEISNFARPGFECRHNLVYWNRGEYLGLGCAAHSLLDGRRFSNPASLDAYLSGVRCVGEERLTRSDAMEETLMLSTRTVRGLDLAAWRRDFGREFSLGREAALARLRRGGLIDMTDGFLRLTTRGMELQDAVVLELLEDGRC